MVFHRIRYCLQDLSMEKNIWKNHYGKTLKVINALKAKNINVVLNTSCSPASCAIYIEK